MKAIAAAAAVGLLAPIPGVASGAVAGEPAPPTGVVIDVVTVNGSSCRPGTAAVAVSPDRTAFTVTYSEYLAWTGPGGTSGDARKKCKLNLTIHATPGFTYAVAQADYRGFAELATGATAVQRASYRFQGERQTGPVDHPFAGPYSEYWQASDRIDPAALVFGACGKARRLDIDTELSVTAGSSDPTATSVIAMDSADGSIETTYHFVWRTCQ